MMKCKHCNGNGGYLDMNRWRFCEQCDGTGQDGLSNEEHLRSCTTEQFAEWIAKQCGNAVMDSTYDIFKLSKKSYWVEWLKQPHR